MARPESHQKVFLKTGLMPGEMTEARCCYPACSRPITSRSMRSVFVYYQPDPESPAELVRSFCDARCAVSRRKGDMARWSTAPMADIQSMTPKDVALNRFMKDIETRAEGSLRKDVIRLQAARAWIEQRKRSERDG